MMIPFGGTCAADPVAVTAAPPATMPTAPFTWEVQAPASPGGTTSSRVVHYLVGSVHLLPESAYPLPSGLQAAYDQSTALVLETDLAALDQPPFQKRFLDAAHAPAGLKASIDAPLYDRLQERAAVLHLPGTVCDPFRAWFCAVTLEVLQLQTQGVSGQLGLDRYFYNRSLADKRAVRWLEAPEQQLAIFTTMNAAQSAEFLAATLDDIGDASSDPAELLHQWLTDDRTTMTRVVADMKSHYPESYERLLGARNRAWVAPLEARFGESRPLLVVVGAAHLLGPDGLPALLAADGWVVTPVLGSEPARPVPPVPPEAAR